MTRHGMTRHLPNVLLAGSAGLLLACVLRFLGSDWQTALMAWAAAFIIGVWALYCDDRNLGG